jgi:Mn2+/Fe2+ NRAMP family transporter
LMEVTLPVRASAITLKILAQVPLAVLVLVLAVAWAAILALGTHLLPRELRSPGQEAVWERMLLCR